jgi:hypothetical protein
MPFKRTSVNVINGSLTNQAVELQANNFARQHIFIQNTSDTVMWLRFGAVAAANAGISLAPGASWSNLVDHCPRNSISLFCAGTAKTYAYYIV